MDVNDRPSETRVRGRLYDVRAREVDVPAAIAFAPITRIGGETGWYAFDRLWRVRGFVDLLLGGVGARRGRTDAGVPRVGDALDGWRVEAFEPDRLLRLRAEMKLPGTAWLEFEVEPTHRGSLIVQTAVFEPTSLLGTLYWYSIHPLHGAVFEGMLSGIEKAALSEADSAEARRIRDRVSSSMSPLAMGRRREFGSQL